MKRFISIVLSLAMICSLCVSGYAYDEKDSAYRSDEVILRDYSLSDLAAAFKSDPTVRSVQMTGNLLSYTLLDGTTAQVTETPLSGGARLFHIQEGTRTAIITLDASQNRIYYNNQPVYFSCYVSDQIPAKAGNAARTEWIYSGMVNYNATSTILVRNMLPAAVYLLISTVVPAFGLTLGICQLIIGWYDLNDILSKSIYIRRYGYHDPSYYGYMYIYFYYCDPGYALLVPDATHTDIIWT